MTKSVPRRVHKVESRKTESIESHQVQVAKRAQDDACASMLAKFDVVRSVLQKAMQRKQYKGIPIVIDRPKGFVQTGKDEDGNEWSRTYKVDYGYIRRTEGGDGEPLDVFLGEDDSEVAHWVRQIKGDGSFDEYKLMLGFKDRAAAKACYLDHVPQKYFSAMYTTDLEVVRLLLGFDPRTAKSAKIEETFFEQWQPEGTTFTEHARNWLEERGLFDESDDGVYGGMLGQAVMRMVETFSEEGHSGMSARFAREIFNAVCDAWEGTNTLILNDAEYQKALAALTNDVEKVCKAFEPERVSSDSEMQIAKSFTGKAADEQYIFGIVLEPEQVDSQGDIYSAEDVRKAAHDYMETFRNIGLQHKELINHKVAVVESFIAPCEMNVEGTVIKAGTWLIGAKVKDADLWRKVKQGELTGFSIGGVANKTPVAS